MKLKVSLYFIATIIVLIVTVMYHQTNYKTLEDAISESNIPIDLIYHTTENKGHTIAFYGKDDILSVGLIEKNFFGYHWVIGTGSRSFNLNDQIITRSFNNLYPRDWDSDGDLVSLTFGVINDDSIDELLIKYKDSGFSKATIIEIPKGRIWFSFSERPVNSDPEVLRVYKDGSEKLGWYK